MRILIVGGYGFTGKALTRHLLARTEHSLIIAGRSLEKAQAFVRVLENPRLTAAQVDACDPASLRSVLQRSDLVLVAAPTTGCVETVVTSAIDTGVDYLDIQLSDRKLEVLRAHERDLADKGLCFVTEAGFHPGLPSALVRYAATRIDCLDSALTAGYLSIGGCLPYTEAVDELMEVFLNYQAQVFKNGRWTTPSAYDLRTFDFGTGIGRRTCYSMFFEELRGLPGMFPTLKDAGFYMASTGWILDVVTMVVFLGLKIARRRGLRPLGTVMWWAMTALSSPPHRVVLQVEASGQRDGRPLRMRTRLGHADGYEFTAIPVVAFLMQYDEIRSRGLHLMGQLCNPRRLVADMQAMGVQLTEDVE
jgi:saccharopine dehydrogenase-like NADP-dependent oxidoreductase